MKDLQFTSPLTLAELQQKFDKGKGLTYFIDNFFAIEFTIDGHHISARRLIMHGLIIRYEGEIIEQDKGSKIAVQLIGSGPFSYKAQLVQHVVLLLLSLVFIGTSKDLFYSMVFIATFGVAGYCWYLRKSHEWFLIDMKKALLAE